MNAKVRYSAMSLQIFVRQRGVRTIAVGPDIDESGTGSAMINT